MTWKNIRAARSLVQTEIDPVKRLKWAHEVPGNTYRYIKHNRFHLTLTCTCI